MWLALLIPCLINAASLQEMLDGLKPGQTLVVPNGTYPGFLLEDKHFPSPVTIRAESSGKVIVMDNSATDQPCWVRRCSGIRFEGIMFASKKSHAVHIDGVPWPEPNLSSDIQLNDCTLISLGEHYCAKISQARQIAFDRCYFFVPERSKVDSHLGGGLDAVAVDDLVIRYCRFDIRKSEACTLMVKGGSENVTVRDSIFDSPAATTFFLAGPTDPSYRTRPEVRFELEGLSFRNNIVHFQSSEGENLHGTWDSLGRAEFSGNTFTNVGQILFVGKRTEADLRGCENIRFTNNEIHLREQGFASPYNALITSQMYQPIAGDPEQPVLPGKQFHAEGNIVYTSGPVRPEETPWISTGFTYQPAAPSSASR